MPPWPQVSKGPPAHRILSSTSWGIHCYFLLGSEYFCASWSISPSGGAALTFGISRLHLLGTRDDSYSSTRLSYGVAPAMLQDDLAVDSWWIAFACAQCTSGHSHVEQNCGKNGLPVVGLCRMSLHVFADASSMHMHKDELIFLHGYAPEQDIKAVA